MHVCTVCIHIQMGGIITVERFFKEENRRTLNISTANRYVGIKFPSNKRNN